MIRSLVSTVSLLAVLAVATGCDSSEAFDISAYTGTYAGTRTVTDAGNGASDSEAVTLTVAADASTGRVSLTIDPEVGGPEVLSGTYDEEGIDIAFSRSGVAIDFSVGVEGAIAGTYTLFGETSDVTGQLTPTQFDLTFAAAAFSGSVRTEIRTSR